MCIITFSAPSYYYYAMMSVEQVGVDGVVFILTVLSPLRFTANKSRAGN